MGLAREHELHKRRRGRNTGLGVVLAGFVVLIFALTMAKLKTSDDPAAVLDHRVNPGAVEVSQ